MAPLRKQIGTLALVAAVVFPLIILALFILLRDSQDLPSASSTPNNGTRPTTQLTTAHYRLQISTPGDDRLVDLIPGDSILIDTAAVTVGEIGPWSGLLADSQGIPMARIALRKGEEEAFEYFAITEAWSHFDGELAVKLVWCESEDQARGRMREGFDAFDGARWGVQDGGRMHWFESFAPGTALETAGGSLVTLLAIEEARPSAGKTRPAIHVQTAGPGGGTSDYWVYSEASEVGSPVRFHAPAVFPAQARLFAWRAGEALLALTGRGIESASSRLTSGCDWIAVGRGYSLRLSQLLPRAVPIDRDSSVLTQLSLETPQGPVILRQGEALRLGDAILRLVRR